VQLCAQAVALEVMLGVAVSFGAIFRHPLAMCLCAENGVAVNFLTEAAG
jgi:hypothetical protein